MRYTRNLKKEYDDYYLYNGNTVYSTDKEPRSEYVSPYKENIYHPVSNITKQMCYNKLGQYEDIEEELGIDLITFYKALTEGVWIKNIAGQIYFSYVYLHTQTLAIGGGGIAFCFITPNNELLLFGDIKQIWALEKKELENDK